ncbi:MAG: lamin tail domain-containing protein [Deltaproteobacteria bacterium]|nr:lamin tail domain-containing protein [Deltaproteobacteria bacterium]
MFQLFGLVFFLCFALSRDAFAILPLGFHDVTDCTSLQGWTCDPDDYTQPLAVHFYEGSTFLGGTSAEIQREDAVGERCGGATDVRHLQHGYNWTVPAPLRDGVSHNITVYAIDVPDPNQHTVLGTFTYNCSPTSTAVVISEIMYHPAEVNADTLQYDSRDDAEFIEIHNVDTNSRDLTGWCFAGITFCFPGGSSIPAGGYLVLAKNAAKFRTIYGLTADGQYGGSLSNSGEVVSLLEATGTVVDAVPYADHAPWPVTADGGGPSLELIAVGADHADPYNWAASTTPAGHTARQANSVAAPSPRPAIHTVSATPFRPNPDQPISVATRISGALSVELVYRIGFGLEQSVFLDNAGANLYQGIIPGQRAGTLVRYRVVATNQNGTARYPRADDTIIYDGVVVTDPGRPASAYPVVEWFYENPTSTNSVIAYEGKVYDSVTTYLRRGRHWKVELPQGHLFAMPGFISYPMDEFAFNVPDQPGWAKSMVRTQLWYAIAALAGEPKVDSFTVRVDTNGTPWEIRAFQANMDDEWRKYQELDGSYYEFGSSGIEKKSPKDADFGELDALNRVINGPKSAIFDVYDVPRMVNFAAVTSLICHWDNAQKNFYLYREPKSGRWNADIWDVDASPSGPYFGGLSDGGECDYQTVPLHNRHFGRNIYAFPFLQYPETKAMFQRRLRTLADRFYVPGVIDHLLTTFANPTDPDVSRTAGPDVAAAQDALLDYITWQRNRINTDSTFPVAWSGATPILINEIQYNPAGGRAEEFVELFNTSENESIDLSGWQLDGVELTFPPGTVILPQSSLVVAADSPTFIRTYGSGKFVAADFDGELDNSRETLTLRLPDGTVVDEVTYGGAGWPQPTKGRSLERTSLAGSSNNPANWAVSLTAQGTPHTKNSTASFNLPPTITPPGDQTHFAGNSVSLVINASDPEQGTLIYSASNLPFGLSIDARTGVISGIVARGNHSVYRVTVSASDGIDQTSVSFTWTIAQLSDTTANVMISVDNAYELYVNGVLVGTGNDWFNAQTFSTLPLRLGRNVIAVKGTNAGWVAGMLTEVSVGGQRLGTSSAWKVSAQEEPGWNTVGFDDRSWVAATAYGNYGVEPWGTRATGIPVDTPAQWIWTADNDSNDTVYLRYSFSVEPVVTKSEVTISVDNTYELYLNGALVGTGNDWFDAHTFYDLALQAGRNVIAVKGTNADLIAGMLAEIVVDGQRIGTSSGWKVSAKQEPGWNSTDFDDSDWVPATAYGRYGAEPWGTRAVGIPIDTPAQWIWSADDPKDSIVYFRYDFDS